MSPCVKGVQVWNSLCDDLKTVNIVTAFKRKCKIFYLRNLVVVNKYNYATKKKYNMCKDVYLCYTLTFEYEYIFHYIILIVITII